MQKNKEQKEIELIKCIRDTKRRLNTANKNFETAEAELIDYYAYQIKAEKAKLDYLIKEVKNLSEVIKITLDVNTEAVDQAKTAVEGATYSNVDQADVNTQALAKAEVESIIDALDLKGATYTIVEEDFTAAVAESAAGEVDGVDGSYKFKVKLTKGEATDTTTEITLTIDHTPGV